MYFVWIKYNNFIWVLAKFYRSIPNTRNICLIRGKVNPIVIPKTTDEFDCFKKFSNFLPDPAQKANIIDYLKLHQSNCS